MADCVQKSYLWTTSSSGDGSATYTQADWSNICRILSATSGSQGIAPNFMNCYSAACEVGTIVVNTGAALVDGKPHHCTTAGSVAIPAAGAGTTRIDRITLRAMWNAGDASPATVRIYRLAGTDSGAPTAPALVQTSGSTWDVPLYKVTINAASTITAMVDERYYSSCALTGGGIQATSCGLLMVAPGHGNLPQVFNRQGYSACNWGETAESGLTNYTVSGSVRVQAGAIQAEAATVTVTFPVAFSRTPAMTIGEVGATTGVHIDSISATQAVLHGTSTIQANWIAIGPA